MDTKRYIKQNTSRTHRDKVQSLFKQHKAISDLVNRNADLLYVLVYQRVMSANELIQFLGFPKARVFRGLKELKNCNLVIRVNFEIHTLYAINGHYLHFIKSLLRYDELSGI